MESVNISPPSVDPAPPAVPPPRRDWIDVAVRIATSWVGVFTAYLVAVILAITKFKELTKGLHEIGIPPIPALGLLIALPVFALVFCTIPSFLEQRRIKRYSEVTGAIQTGYFTLRPRESEETFGRADNAHQEILRWIESTKEPVLYLTGASGTGKSSVLSAWVKPKLLRQGYLIFEFRGYEDIFERIKHELIKPGVIWDRAVGRTDDLQSLLVRATHRLSPRRVLIIVDQFEEFLIVAGRSRQEAFRHLLKDAAIEGLTFLLVFRPEYEFLIQEQSWPALRLDRNRRVTPPFTENAANDFMKNSGLTVDINLMRAVLREAADIEQTVGLIRPVTINLCGLVLGRFSSGLPRRFRAGLIRGFLTESLSLPEVGPVARKVIPLLISTSVTKQPRTITELALATHLAPTLVRGCLRRLGESDRAIVRPLDQEQELWEISHDFLVPLLDSILARRTVSLWRRFRPWLPWVTAALFGLSAAVIPWATSQNPRTTLISQGWMVSENRGTLQIRREDPIPMESLPVVRGLPSPLSIIYGCTNITEVSALHELRNVTHLDLTGSTDITDISALRQMNSLTALYLSGTKVSDISSLSSLNNLKHLHLSRTNVSEISALKALQNLVVLDISRTKVSDLSDLRNLTNISELDLSNTNVRDITPLRNLKRLTRLNLGDTDVRDISVLKEMKSLVYLDLRSTSVSDLAAIKSLTSLTSLDLDSTKNAMKDVALLRDLGNLTHLSLSNTSVEDVSALRSLSNLTHLYLGLTRVTDVSGLRSLTSLKELSLSSTGVKDVSALKGLTNLKKLDLRLTGVKDVSALEALRNLQIER